MKRSTYDAKYSRSEKGRATRAKAQVKYRKTAASKASQKAYFSSDAGKAAQARSDAKRFSKFKRSLAIRIECLQHTSPQFWEARVQEILDWAGSRHSYWVDSEIENAA